MRRRDLLLALLAYGSRALASPTQRIDTARGIHWPAFRGPKNSGVSHGFATPRFWNADPSHGPIVNVLWETSIPGMGHSSPIVWGNRLFLTTAEDLRGKPALRLGLYGDPAAAKDEGDQLWRVYCLDKHSGKTNWEQQARKGQPRATRHPKATHANSTLTTDGRYMVAFFGSEGLYCYDLKGSLRWKKDLGVIDLSKYGIGWGYASSPTLYGDTILLQCDAEENPFLVALNIQDGRERWRVSRRGVCDRSWGTPFVYAEGLRAQVVTNGYPYIASYDLTTGAEIWRLQNEGDNPIPTPFTAAGLIFVASSHGGKAPLYAIRPNARGDITPSPGRRTNEFIVWSYEQNGAYIQTPLAYGNRIFSGTNAGVVKCYEARTGRRLYQQRLGTGRAGFSASPVAANGKIYFSSEDGEVYVIAAGPEFHLLATNHLGDSCMATPAVSEGVLYFRTISRLIAVGETSVG